jgi:hypothetical protein
MPSRCDIDVQELKPWLGNLILVEVRHQPLDFYYKVFGSLISQSTNRDLTGKWLSQCVEAGYATVATKDAFEAVLHHCAPLFQSESLELTPGRLWQVVDILLPFSNDGQVINHIMVGTYPLTTAMPEPEITF